MSVHEGLRDGLDVNASFCGRDRINGREGQLRIIGEWTKLSERIAVGRPSVLELKP